MAERWRDKKNEPGFVFQAWMSTVDELEDEIDDLKSWVVTFLGVHAVQYSADHQLNGLHPTHYDMLVRCGARMVDFKRAELPQ